MCCVFSLNGSRARIWIWKRRVGVKVGVWNIWDISPQPEVKLTSLTSTEKPDMAAYGTGRQNITNSIGELFIVTQWFVGVPQFSFESFTALNLTA